MRGNLPYFSRRKKKKLFPAVLWIQLFEVDRKQYFTRHKLPCGWVLTWRHNTFWDCQVWYQLQSKTFCGSVTAQAWPQTGCLLLQQLQMASIDLCLFYHLRVTVCHRGLVENYYWSNLHDTYRFHIWIDWNLFGADLKSSRILSHFDTVAPKICSMK